MENTDSKKIIVLRETEHWLAISKPAGVSVERPPHGGHESVEQLVFDELSKTKKIPFVGIVHRLDRPVGGAMLFAKKKSSLRELNRLFSERRIEKIYQAKIAGKMAEKAGRLEHFLTKNPALKKAEINDKPLIMSVLCQLDYRVLDENGRLEIQLGTGKYHQIRAQLAHVGCPILGDKLYGSEALFRPDAIALFSWKLLFKDPFSNEKIEIIAAPNF